MLLNGSVQIKQMGLINKILTRIFEPEASGKLEEILKDAREASKTGNFYYVAAKLNLAKYHAKSCELQISDGELNCIKEIAGMIEFNNLVKQAKDSADDGYVPGTANAIKSIKELAEKTNKKHDEFWESNVMYRAYSNGIERYFKSAESHAEEGWVGDTWHLLYRARACAKKVGVNIKDKEHAFFLKYPGATHPDLISPILERAKKELIEPCFFDD